MYHNFAEVKIALSSGKSVLDIVGEYLRNIEQNKDLNAFLEVFKDSEVLNFNKSEDIASD